MTFKKLYRSYFKIKSLGIGLSLLRRGSAWKTIIKEANFRIFFSDSSQMMLKLGRNIRWVEIL